MIFDIVRFSNEVVAKRECLLQVKKMQTWIHGIMHSFNTILFPSKYSLFHRVPWRWRYCKSKQCSNDNFPTSAKPSEVKENTNEQFHFIRYHIYSILTLSRMLMSAPSRTSSSDTAIWPLADAQCRGVSPY